MKPTQEVINKADELFHYYDDLLERELKLKTLHQNSEITEYIKDCARKTCSELITELEKCGESGRVNFWFAVRSEIERT